jgi:outer membrane protein assembly factor BamB
VIAYFGSAGAYCYDVDGKELWHRDVGKVDSWQGCGSSPILYQNLCILNAGPGTQAKLIACDKQSGQVVWQVEPPKMPGGAAPGAPPPVAGGFDSAINQADPSGAGGFLGSWATPLIVHEPNRDVLIVIHPGQATAYEPLSGKIIWICKGLPEQAFASPMIADGILVACGHRMQGGGTRVTAIPLLSQDNATVRHFLWQVDLPKECVGSGMAYNAQVFLMTQFGSLVCLDLSTGTKRWEKRLSGQGTVSGSWSSITRVGDKLLIPNHSSEVFVAAASNRFNLLDTNWIGQETCCASLAISDGDIFLRTYKQLWCIGQAH